MVERLRARAGMVTLLVLWKSLISHTGGIYESAYVPQSRDWRSRRQRISAYRRLACELHSGAGQRTYGTVDLDRCAADGRDRLCNSEQAVGVISSDPIGAIRSQDC